MVLFRRDWTIVRRFPRDANSAPISLIKVHLFCVPLGLPSSSPPSSVPPGRIVNCLIDKITTASYMRRESSKSFARSLTTPRRSESPFVPLLFSLARPPLRSRISRSCTPYRRRLANPRRSCDFLRARNGQ